MFKYIILACVASIGFSHKPNIAVLEERMPNGDENEIVSIDLKKRDGSEDIVLTAQLRFHMMEGQVYVNGNPITHGIVNSVRMLVSIVEIERNIKKTPRLAPVLFRVLVIEVSGNENKKLLAEVEFVQVEEYEVLQVDIKQIIWEGSNRLPMASVSFEDSIIYHKPHEEDHPMLVKDNGFKPHHHHKHHHGRHHHRRHHCWFSRLSTSEKILVITCAALILIGLLILTVICWKRRRAHKMKLNVETPMDNRVEVNGCDDNGMEKKDITITDDGDFHMVINEGYVGDKKELIE